MLNPKQRQAVRLLFEAPEEKVAEMLGVKLDTLRRWKGKREFIDAMQLAATETRQSATRILSNALAHAAERIHEMVAIGADTQPLKPDAKVMVDMLKASGMLEAVLNDTGESESLASILAQLAQEEDEPDSD
ncbi:MAG: hypothetical protein Q7N50_15655 [Armatimonadota bacterium]|nr:hypothetical protein [Armatimonadota bacterium]